MQLSGVGCGQTHAVTISHFHPAFPALPFFAASQTNLFTPCPQLSDSNTPQRVLHSPRVFCTAPQGTPSPAGSAPGPGEQLPSPCSDWAPHTAGVSVSVSQQSQGREGKRATPP